MSEDTRVLVHHPGSNHLAYELVASLQQSGYATEFATGFFYTESGWPARLARALPSRLRNKLERELKRRSHPRVDPRQLSLYATPELVCKLSPELLPAVRARWRPITLVAGALLAVLGVTLPSSGAFLAGLLVLLFGLLWGPSRSHCRPAPVTF